MIFSVGYAGKTIELFAEHLKRHGVQVLADVRSVPGSRAFPDFNENALGAALKRHGIQYRTAGDRLGPRSHNPHHYDAGGQVQFSRLRETPEFRRAIESLVSEGESTNIACMCAEKFAETCHRSLLVGEALHALKVPMQHILFDGGLESQAQMRERLGENQGGMFPDVDLAVESQILRFAYRKPTETDPSGPV